MIELSISIPGNAIETDRLATWIRRDDSLRGNVSLLPPQPDQGTMGGIDVLRILIEGGVVTTAAATIIAWIRTRPGKLTILIRHGDREVTMTAENIRSIGAGEAIDSVLNILTSLEKD